MKQSKFDNRIAIHYFFMKIWSSRCQKTAKVTKVPYLLDIKNDYFTIFFYNSAIATVALNFRFVGCNKKEPALKNGDLRTWCALCVGANGQVTEKFYCGIYFVTWWFQKSLFKEHFGITKKKKLKIMNRDI